MLWVGRGSGRADVRPFFELLGAEGRAQLAAVVMDMNGAFEAEVRAQCPRSARPRPSSTICSTSSRGTATRSLIREHLTRRADRVRSRELLAANKALFTVHVLKGDLKHLWEFRYRGAAQRFWDDWYQRAISSRIPALGSASPAGSGGTCPASWCTVSGRCTPACSKA